MTNLLHVSKSLLPQDVLQLLKPRVQNKTIFFPEGYDLRVQQAAAILENDFCVHAVLGQTPLHTWEQLAPACEALTQHHVHAVVAGCTCPTAFVVRAALKYVGLASHIKTLTSCFLMQLPNALVTYADCGVVVQPTPQQLSDIAFLSARAHEQWTKQAPRIAFLSFATHQSAQHDVVHQTQQALQLFKQQFINTDEIQPSVSPTKHWMADGPLQFDAAFVPDVAQSKCPESPLQGQGNVYIFPDLNCGNIAYKITQRVCHANAFGPILLGARLPISDLSRGASAQDIVGVSLLTLGLQ